MANHGVKTFRFAGRLPSPHCVDVVETQVSQISMDGKQPQYQSTRYFIKIVYLHVIEDNFRNPSHPKHSIILACQLWYDLSQRIRNIPHQNQSFFSL